MLRVVLRDALFLVLDKPAGLLSVPGKGGAADAATLAAEWWRKRTAAAAPDAAPPLTSLFRSARPAGLLSQAEQGPRIVHRLDEATSGLILMPLSGAALTAVATLFVQRRIRKVYEAVLDTRANGGALADEGVVSTALGPNSHVSILQTWLAEASAPAPLKAAETRWRVLERGDGAARVEFVPVTGRTHQLRLHAALPPPHGLGCPIVGDPFYGDPLLTSRSFQHRLTDAVRDEGAGSVAALLLHLAAQRAALAPRLFDMPELRSCCYLRAPAALGPLPRMLLHARELAIPDDFGGHCGEVAEGDAEEALPVPEPPEEIGGAAAAFAAVGPGAVAAALSVSAAVESWPRFGFRNASTRRPALRRVMRFRLAPDF